MPSRSQIENAIIQLITDPLNRQNTAAKVREVMRLLNNALFNAEDDELTIQHIKGLANALATGGGVPTPDGVSWVVTPAVQLNGNTIQVSPGSVRVEGVEKNVAQRTITETARPEGDQTPFTAVLNPFATPPEVELLEGDTVAENDSYAFPATPADRMFIGNFMLSSIGFAQVATGAVKEVSINGGASQLPNAQGKLDLTVPTGGNVNTVNNVAPDANKNVLLEGKDIDTAVADPGFFGLAAGVVKLKIKAAIDVLASKIGNLSALTTTNKTTLVAAINEVKASAKAPFTLEYTIGLDTFDLLALRGRYSLVVNLPAGVTSMAYYFSTDEGITYSTVKTLAEINTWLNSTVSSTTDWTVKFVPTFAAGASGIKHVRGIATAL